jgi:hypothetical protein
MSYGQISTNLGLSKGTLHAIMEVGTHWDGGFGVQVLEEGGCLPWNRTRQSSTSCHKEVRVGFALQHLPQDDAFWSRVVHINVHQVGCACVKSPLI